MAFNRRYQEHLRARMELEPWRAEAIRSVLEEADWLWRVWDTADDAVNPWATDEVRRNALRKLAGYIGRDAYWRGQLPPPVPTWRFQELR
jgi:hypothetical protein